MRVVLGLAVLLALAIAGWLLFHRPELPPAPPPQPPAADAALPPPRAPDAPLPPTADSDARVRSLFGPLSALPGLREWLSTPDLLERGAAVIDNVAEGVSPRKQVPFLAPHGAYQPHQFNRYDPFAGVIGSIDARALAGALRALHPLLESAYHRLGYPDRSLDATLARALQRIADAPLVDAEVRPRGQVFVYTDPRLEALGPVEKHLLRMGPRNEKVVQDQARALLAALREK